MNDMLKRFLAALTAAQFMIICLSCTVAAESPSNRGVISVYDPTKAFNGYTLFNPNMGYNMYLIDMHGNTVHQWLTNRRGGSSAYLLENGNVIWPADDPSAPIKGGGGSGYIQEYDWDGNMLWEFKYSDATVRAHHDIEPLPNGNVLAIAWEVKSAAEAAAAGRKSSQDMWPDHIIEINKTTSTIVWEWHSWDHLIQDYSPAKANYGVVGDHPELFDINMGFLPPGGGDWQHLNSISYNPESDQIVVSSHTMDEIYVIDHGTSTLEAKGHAGGRWGKGGDILYRWGCPGNYRAPGTKYFDVVHGSYWVPKGLPGEGNIMAFNNNDKAGASIIAEITPPVDVSGNYIHIPGTAYGPSTPNWTYSNGTNFYSQHLGSNQRLPNGNTFICEATRNHLLEVTSIGEVVWDYWYTSQISRSLRYAPDYPGLSKLVPEIQIIVVPLVMAPFLWFAVNVYHRRIKVINRDDSE
jgi:hypothetical protein